jgi:hypothetical protein
VVRLDIFKDKSFSVAVGPYSFFHAILDLVGEEEDSRSSSFDGRKVYILFWRYYLYGGGYDRYSTFEVFCTVVVNSLVGMDWRFDFEF